MRSRDNASSFANLPELDKRMDLWNEYEGRSIAGLFPLERLIRPEGRSAFFTTTTSGTSTVIRLIESHFDEDEILARWTGVSGLHQPNLLTLTRFGQAMMDETSLVYVVLEPTEADLGQILCERPLTLAETRQVAVSLIPALQALHARGFIHEHIQPANVLAVGEVVKLRSDCIREAPEGAEGTALRSRDVQDFATLLLQCLTQQRNPAFSPTEPPMPAPFREIIHNGIFGAWNLAKMVSALEATAPQAVKVHESARVAASASSNLQELHHKPSAVSVEQATIARAADQDEPHIAASAPHPFSEPVTARIRVPMRRQSESPQRWLIMLAIAGVCLMLFATSTVMRGHGSKTAAASPTISSETSRVAASRMPDPGPVASATVADVAPEKRSSATASRNEWRIVAFTYNKRDQAAAKARSLEQSYASLHPAVFTPTGHAPYLVTLGGLLDRDTAFRLKSKLRGAGLPHDLYAQNYSSKFR